MSVWGTANGDAFLCRAWGAGATSWAHLLGALDGGLLSAKSTWTVATVPNTVLVTRGSIDGIDAAKAAIAIHGYERFACVLLVPALPGRLPRLIADEVKVLSGALPIVHVPWLPSLLTHRASQLSPADISPKELTKIITGLSAAEVFIEGATS